MAGQLRTCRRKVSTVCVTVGYECLPTHFAILLRSLESRDGSKKRFLARLSTAEVHRIDSSDFSDRSIGWKKTDSRNVDHVVAHLKLHFLLQRHAWHADVFALPSLET